MSAPTKGIEKKLREEKEAFHCAVQSRDYVLGLVRGLRSEKSLYGEIISEMLKRAASDEAWATIWQEALLEYCEGSEEKAKELVSQQVKADKEAEDGTSTGPERSEQ